jgi:hypothetical protein|tara:strand:+ start:140 stop:532 length:393 start_codon:yes stop_codon:yes gene_type:complete
MMEDDFYATIKLKTGEELFCKVAAEVEDDRTMLVVSNPIIIQEVKGKMGVMGYKMEPWLKTTNEDMFIINMVDVLTMSESSDIEMIFMYQHYVNTNESRQKGSPELNRKMGYLGKVNDTKELLEKIYKNS